jgi:hypothetical protein
MRVIVDVKVWSGVVTLLCLLHLVDLCFTEFLGSLYLTAFLATLREQGYSIFVVKGQLPQTHPDAGSDDTPGKWFTPQQVQPMGTITRKLLLQELLWWMTVPEISTWLHFVRIVN